MDDLIVTLAKAVSESKSPVDAMALRDYLEDTFPEIFPRTIPEHVYIVHNNNQYYCIDGHSSELMADRAMEIHKENFPEEDLVIIPIALNEQPRLKKEGEHLWDVWMDENGELINVRTNNRAGCFTEANSPGGPNEDCLVTVWARDSEEAITKAKHGRLVTLRKLEYART